MAKDPKGDGTGPRVCPHDAGTTAEPVMENGRVAYELHRCNRCTMIIKTVKR